MDFCFGRDNTSHVLYVCFVVSFRAACFYRTNSLCNRRICGRINVRQFGPHSVWGRLRSETERICIRTTNHWKRDRKANSWARGTSFGTAAEDSLRLWLGVTRSVHYSIFNRIWLGDKHALQSFSNKLNKILKKQLQENMNIRLFSVVKQYWSLMNIEKRNLMT